MWKVHCIFAIARIEPAAVVVIVVFVVVLVFIVAGD